MHALPAAAADMSGQEYTPPPRPRQEPGRQRARCTGVPSFPGQAGRPEIDREALLQIEHQACDDTLHYDRYRGMT